MYEYTDTILIRYGEIGLKDRNRGQFEVALVDNIKTKLSDLKIGSVRRFQGGLEVKHPATPAAVLERLERIPGIVWFAPCAELNRDLRDVQAAAKQLDGPGSETDTFAVDCQRSDKSFGSTSMEVEQELGRFVEDQTGLTVDLEDPDWTLGVHVLGNRILLFEERREGPGGLPVGTVGSVLSLISGGIDSPVASVMTQKRGSRTDFLHVYAYPDPETAFQKHLGQLLEAITRYGQAGRVFMVPYTPFELEAQDIPRRLQIVLFRRHVVRLANRVAEQYDHQAFVTGDSLGQVASQTMENLQTVDAAAQRPVLRPLIGLDKTEIVQLGRDYGTYRASVKEHQDCCSIQDPHPETRSNLATVQRAEQQADMEAVDESAFSQHSVYRFEPPKGANNLIQDQEAYQRSLI